MAVDKYTWMKDHTGKMKMIEYGFTESQELLITLYDRYFDGSIITGIHDECIDGPRPHMLPSKLIL